MGLNPLAGRVKSRSWFWWGINLGIFLALIVWWWMETQSKEPVKLEIKEKPLVLPDDEPIQPPPEPRKPTGKAPLEPDNLELIEGLGPRSAQVLAQAGISTFSQISSMTPDAIRDVLRASGVYIAYPATWPEQAALAADQRWDDLEKLKSELKGGSRS
jgi:predicted flap endonuclease-1-like 5' DNA nuclease